MTLNLSVTDDKFGQFVRRAMALAERGDKSVPFDHIMDTIQAMHDGKPIPFVDGLRGHFLDPQTASLTIGGVPKDALIEQGKAVRTFDSYAVGMMGRDEFTTLAEPEKTRQIFLAPKDLGFTENPPRDDLLNNDRLAAWSAANFEDHVVELNPAEAGPHTAIQYTNQPRGEVLWIGMKPTPAAGGRPSVFYVRRDAGGEAWLRGRWIAPIDRFDLVDRFSFRLRKVSSALVV